MAMAPPFSLDSALVSQLAALCEQLGRLSVQLPEAQALRLRRANRIRTIQGSLAIEGNTLSESQITAILNGKRVLAPPQEVQEARNALAVYEQLQDWQPGSESDLLAAHKALMLGLIDSAGRYRQAGVGVMKNNQVIHMAPPAQRLPKLMGDLLSWLQQSEHHPLITSAVFHYEFEFIHPFADGNGRMGRLWQTLILAHWNPLFSYLPVESLIHQHQPAYYQAIEHSTALGDAAPFIRFMLGMIQQALDELENNGSPQATPQVAPQVSPQVAQLLQVLNGDMLRNEIQQTLGLKDRKSFNARYLKPALEAGLVEMTLPDKPSSRLQRYRLTEHGKTLKGATA